MRAFITGSRAYGTPREDSDLDLVVLVDEGVKSQLRAFSGVPEDKSVRFGGLNLVLLTSREKYNKWQSVTNQLKLRAPVSHDEAVVAFRAEGLGGDYPDENRGIVYRAPLLDIFDEVK